MESLGIPQGSLGIPACLELLGLPGMRIKALLESLVLQPLSISFWNRLRSSRPLINTFLEITHISDPIDPFLESLGSEDLYQSIPRILSLYQSIPRILIMHPFSESMGIPQTPIRSCFAPAIHEASTASTCHSLYCQYLLIPGVLPCCRPAAWPLRPAAKRT